MPVYLTLGNHEGFSVNAFTTDDNDDNGDDDEDDDNDDDDDYQMILGASLPDSWQPRGFPSKCISYG